MSVETAELRTLALQRYLHTQIPISTAMGVEVVVANDDLVRLRAPLEPNLNHRSTVFGGSAAAVATLAGWALLHVRLSRDGHGSRIVIQKSSILYDRPMNEDFEAVAYAPATEDWNWFYKTLGRKGCGRIEVNVDLQVSEESVGSFTGTYVVLPVDS